jgi:hypothetical protein
LLGYAIAMPRRLVISMHFYKAAAYSISYPIIQIIRDERIRTACIRTACARMKLKKSMKELKYQNQNKMSFDGTVFASNSVKI